MKLKEEFIQICEEYFGLSPSNVWDERVKEGAVNELLALFEKAMNEVINSAMSEFDEKYKSFTIDELVGQVLEYQRKKVKEML